MGDNKTLNKWTEEELNFLKDNYVTKTDREISELLGTHSVTSVATKRKRMHWNRDKKKFSFDDVIKEFSKTSYILISDESDYKDTATNSIKYICPKHKDKGIQTISLGHLKNGRGCYYCGREIVEKARRRDDEGLEIECEQICNEKGFEYKGFGRENGAIVIYYICPKHPLAGVQVMKKENMKRNNIIGCPYCFDTKKFKFSKGEKKVEETLTALNIPFLPQYTFKDCADKLALPFDYYLPSKKACIEYDGQHHYRPVTFNGISEEEAIKNHATTLKHDHMKDEYCANNNIQLLRIPYYDFNNIETLVQEFLNK